MQQINIQRHIILALLKIILIKAYNTSPIILSGKEIRATSQPNIDMETRVY